MNELSISADYRKLLQEGNVIEVARIPVDPDYRAFLRWRMQTDLFFLAKYALGYDKITEEWHRPVCDVFVRKDPNKPWSQQTNKRRRMIFLPRKTYKTTLNICDTVQWVLCFPEIAVMAMTASNSPDSPLADAFVAECASHFVCLPDNPKKVLHLCFPEHVLHKYPKAGEFTTPARRHFRRDPSVKAVSIEQSLSGWHPDVLKSEDVQDNRNSQTIYSLRKVRQNFYINLKMLGEEGLLDLTGTRYGPMDLYGDMIAKAGEESIVYWKPAYIRRQHALKIEDDELTEDDVILQFPEQISWNFLREEKALDESSFWTQYMNVAEGNFKSTFPMERLKAAQVSEDVNEHDGQVHVHWRMEYAGCRYAAGAVGIEKSGRMTIVEVVRGQFAPTSLAQRVIKMCKQWDAHRVEIEDTPGARSMATHIRNEAIAEEWRVDIGWGEFLQDETARALEIKSAEPHLLAGRLLFADGISNVQEVFRQLHHFGLVEDYEVASVISRIAAKLPASIAAEGFEPGEEDAWRTYVNEDAYNRVYGRGKYTEPDPQPEPEEEWEPMQHSELSDWMPGLSG
jgi:hypothetical protein